MLSRLVVLAIIFSVAHAGAQPDPDHLFSIEPSLTGLGPVGAALTLTFAGEWRAPGDNLWYRGALEVGAAVGDDKGGIGELRAGLEYRRAQCHIGCGYAGLDLAAVDFDVKNDPDEYALRGLLAIARGGVDFGGDATRFRIGLELALGAGRYHEVAGMDTTTTRFAGGFAFTSAVAFRF